MYAPEVSDFNIDVEHSPLPSFDEWMLPPLNMPTEHEQNTPQPVTSNNRHSHQDGPHENNWGEGGGFPPAEFRDVDFSSITSFNVISEANLIGSQYKMGYNALANAPPCTCLSSMYLAASNLESSIDFGFPAALTPIKAALTTARSILLCTTCPMKLSSSRKNVTLCFNLLGAIASNIDALFKDIHSEAARADEAGETKILDSGDRSLNNMHLHTGTTDCPGRLALDLEPEEWRSIAKRAVKKHTFKGKNDILSLEALIDALEERQRAWHQGHNPSLETDELRTIAESLPESEWTCLKLTSGIRQMMAHFVME